MEINARELILSILLDIEQKQEHCHIALGNVLAKYQFLPKQDRAFITRVCEGTVEYQIQLDYIINQISSVKTRKMKPVILEILRFSVYQLKYMDSVPDSAVVNEAVKLAKKKGFGSLRNFVNGVLRNVCRNLDHITWPNPKEEITYLSVRYSMPEYLVEAWCREFGREICERMLASFLENRPTTVRFLRTGHKAEETRELLEKDGVCVSPAPYAEDAYALTGYDHLASLAAFQNGGIQIQDVSSMLVGAVSDVQPGNQVLDLCAAPGGKSLHAADRMNGQGMVVARDVTEYKVNLIRENVLRMGCENVTAQVGDATIFQPEDKERFDVVLADVPCTGYGVIGKKPDIKYHAGEEKQQELVELQRRILTNAAECVKPGGVLIYSTCTIGRKENQENVEWFTEHFPYKTESLEPYLCSDLCGGTAPDGWLQLLPGVHRCDGFFLARLRKQADLD